MHNIKALKLFVAALAFYSTGACSDNKTSSPSASQPRGFEPTVLPTVGQGGGCPPDPGTPIEFCDWVQSVDAIVLGTVKDLSPISDLLVSGEEQLETFTECDGPVNVGIRISIQIEALLHGTLDSDEQQNFVVSVGTGQTKGWWPQPDVENGQVAWLKAPNEPLPFQKGTTIGVAASRHPVSGIWSLMGTTPFTVNADGSMIFGADHGQKECPSTTEWSPSTKMGLDDFASDISTCVAKGPTESGVKLNASRKQYRGTPYYSFAGFCIRAADIPAQQ